MHISCAVGFFFGMIPMKKTCVIRGEGIMYTAQRCACASETHRQNPLGVMYRRLPHTFWLYVAAINPMTISKLGLVTSTSTLNGQCQCFALSRRRTGQSPPNLWLAVSNLHQWRLTTALISSRLAQRTWSIFDAVCWLSPRRQISLLIRTVKEVEIDDKKEWILWILSYHLNLLTKWQTPSPTPSCSRQLRKL